MNIQHSPPKEEQIQDEFTVPKGSEVFRRAIVEATHKYRELNLEVWSPTPWMVDVLMTGREHEIRAWLCQNLGRENDGIRNLEGLWRQSNVTLHGYCWHGFKSEGLMNRFVARWPSEPKAKAPEEVKI